MKRYDGRNITPVEVNEKIVQVNEFLELNGHGMYKLELQIPH